MADREAISSGSTGQAGRLKGLRQRLSRTARALVGSKIDIPEYDPGEHGRLVEFRGLEGKEERQRY